MTKLEYIRSKCIEANPDILKLEFGCELEVNIPADGNPWDGAEYSPEKTYKAIVTADEYIQFPNGDHSYDCPVDHLKENVYKGEYVDDEDLTQIIVKGRPIRFADVLLATRKISECYDMDILSLWNLLDNDLNNQSQKCWDLIANLLGYV
jgi:hypothetical protein